MENGSYFQTFLQLLETKPYLVVLGITAVVSTALCFSLTQAVKSALRKRKQQTKAEEPWWQNLVIRGSSVVIGALSALGTNYSLGYVLLPEGLVGTTAFFSAILGATLGATCTAVVWAFKKFIHKKFGV